MAVYSKYGIFEGGEIYKYGSNQLRIKPYKLHLHRNEVTGIGDNEEGFSKRIIVNFGTSVTRVRPVKLSNKETSWELDISATGNGQCYIYYSDSKIAKDIVLSLNPLRPASPAIVFCKLEWSSGASSIDNVTIRTDSNNRDEAIVIHSDNPQSAKHGYYDGQRFTHGSYNTPLTNLFVLSEVLEAESLLTFGGKYFITMAKKTDIIASGTQSGNNAQIKIKQFKSYGRNTNNLFSVYHSKVDTSLAYPDTAYVKNFSDYSQILNRKLYVFINKDTGALGVDINFDDSVNHLIAFADVGTNTNLSAIEFKIMNNFAGHGTLVEALSNYISSKHPAGFLQPVIMEESLSNNRLIFKDNVLNVDGVMTIVPTTEIVFSDPPVTGKVKDFIYLEIKKSQNPWTVIDYTFKKVDNVDFDNYPDPFKQPGKVLNSQGNMYQYTLKGIYRSVHSTEPDGYIYAIPICIVQRLNQGTFNNNLNYAGGAVNSRPDNKVATSISLDETEILAPVCVKQIDNRMIGTAINKILKGELNNKLMPSFIDSGFFSRKPLQIDRVGTNQNISGSTYIGKTDGIRYIWSNDKAKEVMMYFLFKVDIDGGLDPYDFSCYHYDSSLKVLSLKVPDGTYGEILLNNITLQPKDFQAYWVKTGNPVKFSSLWSVEQNDYENRAVTNFIDSSDENYISNGVIAATFKIRYTDKEKIGLSKVPSEIISISYNNDYTNPVNIFAPGNDNYTLSTELKKLTGSSSPKTINSVSIKDTLNLERIGNSYKFYTYEIGYHLAGNAVNGLDFEIPESITYDDFTYDVIGVTEVFNVTLNKKVKITRSVWDNDGFKIRLESPQSNLHILRFNLAIGGTFNKQLDLYTGSLDIGGMAENKVYTVTADHSLNADGVYRISKGELIFGLSSMQNKHGVFINDSFVYCDHIIFKAQNFVEITLSKTTLEGLNPSDWTLISGKYVPKTGVVIRIPVLTSLRQSPPSDIYITYKYNSLPFMPYLAKPTDRFYNDSQNQVQLQNLNAKEPVVINRGFLILSNDGTANERASIFSPVSERFPVVQGIDVIGVNTPTSHVGVNDIINYQSQKESFLEGANIKFDNSMILTTDTLSETGITAWVNLIEQDHIIRLFVYQVRSGAFALNNPDNAFVCELEHKFREK